MSGRRPSKREVGLSAAQVKYSVAKKKYQLSRAARLSGKPFMTFEEWQKSAK